MNRKIVSGDNSTNIISDGDVNLNFQLDAKNLTGELRNIVKEEICKLTQAGNSLELEASRSVVNGDIINAIDDGNFTAY